jgi:hypothetical protein
MTLLFILGASNTMSSGAPFVIQSEANHSGRSHTNIPLERPCHSERSEESHTGCARSYGNTLT